MEDSIDNIESGEVLLAHKFQLWNKSGSLQEEGDDYGGDDVLED